MMRRLDTYIISSELKIALSTLLMCTLMMLLVELFAKFSVYTASYMNLRRTLYLLFLRIPYAINMTAGPALLFATTFFVSSIYSNNELIALLSAGVPYRRIVSPLIILSLFLSGCMFLFNEFVYIPSSVKYQTTLDMYQNYDSSREGDNSNIFYTDRTNNFVIKADKYTDSRKELSGVILVFKNENGSIEERISSPQAIFDEKLDIWVLYNAKIQTIDMANFRVQNSSVQGATMNEKFRTSPDLFKNIRGDIQTMPLKSAVEYIRGIKNLSFSRYAELATEFYERILSCFTVFVMVLVSVSINLRFKKNVLLFSIVASVSLAVVYYVVQLVTLLMARQGVIAPLMGELFPFIAIGLVAIISASTIKS